MKAMFNPYFTYILLIISIPTMAESDSSYQSNCGVFKILGTVKENNQKKLVVVVNEATKSEIILSTPVNNTLKILAYKGKPLIGEFEILKRMNGTFGEISKIIKIDYRSDSSFSTDENMGMSLVKKMKCVE